MKAATLVKFNENIKVALKAQHWMDAKRKELGVDEATKMVKIELAADQEAWDKAEEDLAGAVAMNKALELADTLEEQQETASEAMEKLQFERDKAAKSTATPRGSGAPGKVELGELLYAITQAAGEGNRAGNVTAPLVAIDQVREAAAFYRNKPVSLREWNATDAGNQVVAEHLGGEVPYIGDADRLDLRLPGMKEKLNIGTGDIPGGLAVGTLMVQERMFDMARIMAYANVINTQTGTMLKRRTRGALAITEGQSTTPDPAYGTAIAAIIAEGGAIPDKQPVFGQADLAAFKVGYKTEYTYESLMDMTPGDFARQIVADMGRAMALGLDKYFATGDDSNEPQGITQTSNTFTSANTGAGGKPVANDFIDAKYQIADTYGQCMWYMKYSNLAEIRKMSLASDSTNPLFRVDPTGKWDGYLDGDPVVASSGMPAWKEATVGAVYGDLRSAFDIRLAGPMRLDRSTEVAWVNDEIAWRVLQRVDSVIKDHFAIVALKGAAT